MSPCLWVGTSLGGVISVTLTLPETNDDRVLCLQSVLAVASGNIFRLKGPIKRVAFLDAAGNLINTPESSKCVPKRNDCHYAVLVAEKQARVLQLPQQTCPFKATITQSSFVVRADVIAMKTADGVALVAYLATGNIVIYSLPSLKQLHDIDFLPLLDIRIARTLTFSTNGHAAYLASASEVAKAVISADTKQTINDMQCTLYQPKEMPEPPKQSFFKVIN